VPASPGSPAGSSERPPPLRLRSGRTPTPWPYHFTPSAPSSVRPPANHGPTRLSTTNTDLRSVLLPSPEPAGDFRFYIRCAQVVYRVRVATRQRERRGANHRSPPIPADHGGHLDEGGQQGTVEYPAPHTPSRHARMAADSHASRSRRHRETARAGSRRRRGPRCAHRVGRRPFVRRTADSGSSWPRRETDSSPSASSSGPLRRRVHSVPTSVCAPTEGDRPTRWPPDAMASAGSDRRS
jgi:hypothetical protein